MKVTIHQPVYIPYLGFFSKVASADIFVIYDTAQWEKGSVHNRQRIRTHAGSQWLTIPMSSSLLPYTEAPISYGGKDPWHEAHWRTIEQHYKKTPFIDKYRDDFRRLYTDGHPYNLGEFNMRFIDFFLREAGIKTKVVYFSDLSIGQGLSPSEKLAAAVEKLGGDHYISGPSGKKYMEMEPFDRRKIDVSFFEFHHPQYEQYHSRFDEKFMPNMGSIDALFNLGYLPLTTGASVTYVPLVEMPRSRA
jgi:hypothetical protein